MGYGDVSALNPNSRIHTPALDNLVQEGISFTNAHLVRLSVLLLGMVCSQADMVSDQKQLPMESVDSISR